MADEGIPTEVPATEPGVKAKGKAIPRTEGEIFDLAEIDDADIRAARRDWKDRTIPKYAGLIDAKLEGDSGG